MDQQPQTRSSPCNAEALHSPIPQGQGGESPVWDLIVVGGGAAGLAAGLTAARRGKRVLILERTNECGKKLAVTGGKKGNFTHTDEPETMARQYNTETRVLLKLMRRFPYLRIIEFFRQLGVRHIVDEEGCVWPNPKSAPRLRAALVDAFRGASGIITTHAHVAGIDPRREHPDRGAMTNHCTPEPAWRWTVATDSGRYSTRSVLICTGGMSYPATGSSGDGYELARRLGHRVEPVYSALASLVFDGEFSELSGITIGKTTVTLRIADRLRQDRGKDSSPTIKPSETAPFLFAGKCITGRAVINLCGFAAKALQEGRSVTAIVDWLPDSTEADLREEIAEQRIHHGRMQVNNFIASKSAKRLANLLCGKAGLPGDRIVAELSRAELSRLLDVLKRTEIKIAGAEPLARATVTGGGVVLDEVDLTTFESKLHEGLFFAGEILDVWGRSGGYNLHFAWASGIAAGEAV